MPPETSDASTNAAEARVPEKDAKAYLEGHGTEYVRL